MADDADKADEARQAAADQTHQDTAAATYDPTDPAVPAQSPPLRSTAPQSPFTFSQVSTGFGVLAVGLLLTFGLALLLA
jgi:hypothetical protein